MLACRGFRLSRGGFGGLYETSKVEIGVQIIWDGRLAASCGCGMYACKEFRGFEELGPLQG